MREKPENREAAAAAGIKKKRQREADLSDSMYTYI